MREHAVFTDGPEGLFEGGDLFAEGFAGEVVVGAAFVLEGILASAPMKRCK